MPALDRKVLLKDSSLREGLDTPGVAFTREEKIKIAALLDRAGVQEIEIVAPGFVMEDLAFAELLRENTDLRARICIYTRLRKGNRKSGHEPGQV
jgi:homocitrate synthase NifV